MRKCQNWCFLYTFATNHDIGPSEKPPDKSWKIFSRYLRGFYKFQFFQFFSAIFRFFTIVGVMEMQLVSPPASLRRRSAAQLWPLRAHFSDRHLSLGGKPRAVIDYWPPQRSHHSTQLRSPTRPLLLPDRGPGREDRQHQDYTYWWMRSGYFKLTPVFYVLVN